MGEASAIGSGHDLGVLGSSPVSGSLRGGGLLLPPPARPPACACVCMYSPCQINKFFITIKKKKGKNQTQGWEVRFPNFERSGDVAFPSALPAEWLGDLH